MDETLLSRIEDASLNASAPLQQRWVDGWLVRYAPGKARRARCIHALAEGRMGLSERLQSTAALYASAGLPMVFRITPYSHPGSLDAALEDLGYERQDETCVLVRSLPAGYAATAAQPADTHATALGAEEAVQVLAGLRRSTPEQAAGHLQRLQTSPVPYRAWAIRHRDDGQVLACGQWALEDDRVGLYDVHTHADFRNRGLARTLCDQMLAAAAAQGARLAYLQVEAANAPARRVYDSLGFELGYTYHYRQQPG